MFAYVKGNIINTKIVDIVDTNTKYTILVFFIKLNITIGITKNKKAIIIVIKRMTIVSLNILINLSVIVSTLIKSPVFVIDTNPSNIIVIKISINTVNTAEIKNTDIGIGSNAYL
jgi:hypothetical protein